VEAVDQFADEGDSEDDGVQPGAHLQDRVWEVSGQWELPDEFEGGSEEDREGVAGRAGDCNALSEAAEEQRGEVRECECGSGDGEGVEEV